MTAFLPLGSNAGWFEAASLQHSLALRLKVFLFIEDELVVDADAFHATVTQGELTERALAAAMVPWPRDDPRVVGVASQGRTVEMRMDWQPLLHSAGLASASFVRPALMPLAPAERRSLRACADEMSREPDVSDSLPGSSAVRAAIVKHWLFDCAMAAIENASLAVDARAYAFVNAVDRLLGAVAAPPTSRRERARFSFRLPDVRSWSWQGFDVWRASKDCARLRQVLFSASYGQATHQEVQAEINARAGAIGATGVDIEALPNRIWRLLPQEHQVAEPMIYVVSTSA